MKQALIILLVLFAGGGGYYGYNRWGSGGGAGIGLGTVLVILLSACWGCSTKSHARAVKKGHGWPRARPHATIELSPSKSTR